jgi:hypothetical protein
MVEYVGFCWVTFGWGGYSLVTVQSRSLPFWGEQDGTSLASIRDQGSHFPGFVLMILPVQKGFPIVISYETKSRSFC